MKYNRLIYGTLLIIVTLFVSFYGGSVPYLLFYFVLLLPLFCILYTFIVYMRFRVHQNIDSIRIIKKVAIPYRSILANEDYYTYTSLRPEYFDDYSHVSIEGEIHTYEIQPKTSLQLEGYLKADYRGTFEAGIKSIEIKDFLYLFSIKYPLLSKLKIIVSPRIVSIHKINLVQWMDEQNTARKFRKGTNEMYDPELRKYVKGDCRKHIHWKASAKMQEFMTRKVIEMEEPQPYLFMDLCETGKSGKQKIAIEDNVIEMTLAVISQFMLGKTPLHVCCQNQEYGNCVISDERVFDHFFSFTTEVTFGEYQKIEELIRQQQQSQMTEPACVIVITGKISIELMESLINLNKNNCSVTLFYIGEQNNEKEWNLIRVLKDEGIITYVIHPEEDIEQLYGSKQNKVSV